MWAEALAILIIVLSPSDLMNSGRKARLTWYVPRRLTFHAFHHSSRSLSVLNVPGVVDHNIDATKCIFDPLGSSNDLVIVSDVSLDSQYFQRAFATLCCEALIPDRVQARASEQDQSSGARPSNSEGNGSTDAL